MSFEPGPVVEMRAGYERNITTSTNGLSFNVGYLQGFKNWGRGKYIDLCQLDNHISQIVFHAHDFAS